MTRDNLYWLSHDQVIIFKTFRGTASRCKQTINHAIPSPALCYTISYCTVRIALEYTQKYGFQCQFRKYPQYWLPVPTLFQPTDYQCQYSEFPTILDSCSNSSATERKGEKRGRKCVSRDMGEKEKSK
ncbi:hypothetical protein Lal_00021355 [Lupinus albus]|nr:hypothetical protein Lal_00021355 [Lupinus albus]